MSRRLIEKLEIQDKKICFDGGSKKLQMMPTIATIVANVSVFTAKSPHRQTTRNGKTQERVEYQRACAPANARFISREFVRFVHRTSNASPTRNFELYPYLLINHEFRGMKQDQSWKVIDKTTAQQPLSLL